MKYKLLVLDVDGTLLNNEKEITKSTLATLLKVQQMGLTIVLASGRPLVGLMPIAEKLELNRYGGYIMAFNGSLVVNAKTNETVFEKKIDTEFIPYLSKKAKKNEIAIFTYKEDVIITENANPYIKAEAITNKIAVTEVENFDAAVDFNPYKCVMVDDDFMILENLGENLRKKLNGSLDVFISEDFFLEILPQNVNKGKTLATLTDMLGIKQEELIAIGNGNSDIAMLQMAGVGISMGNASDNVKRCTDYTTLSNEEDGVAAALEKHVLQEIRSASVPLDQLNKQAKHALMGNLGIQYTFASEGLVEATMPVDERTRQPFGILHGGASLALAETVAGLGSMIIAKHDEIVVGMQVSGNHVSSATEGDTVRAVATIIHQGRSSHVWDVNIYTSTNKLISTVRVCNSVLKKNLG